MSEVCFNYKGEEVTGKMILRNEKFGTGKFDKNNNPEINWQLLDECADDEGFDTKKCIENDKYRLYQVSLSKGEKLIRYGHEGGRFTTPAGTTFEMLALPYKKDCYEYHEYIVKADGAKALCIVDKGYVAPGFDMPGGGIQYWHYKNITRSLKEEILEEDYQWKKNIEN